MALFRKKPTTEIPELKEYYEGKRSDRPVVAWALALISLLITVAIVMALFFGGRWLYRTLTDNGDGGQTPAGNGQQETDRTPEPEIDSDEPRSEEEEAEPETPTLPGNTEDDTRDESAPSAPETTPSTGPSELPNTGPSSGE